MDAFGIVFGALVNKTHFEFTGETKNKVIEWLEHYENTCFVDSTRLYAKDALFRREEWNQFENDGSRTNNNGEAYNDKLGDLTTNPNPNIWWLLELINEETTHYVLAYHRHINPAISQLKGFKERKRDPAEIQKDLDIQNLKMKYIKGQIDCFALNDQLAYFMNDFSEDSKKKPQLILN